MAKPTPVAQAQQQATFQVKERISITDPCYEPGTWCAISGLNAMPGTWSAHADLNEDGRVATLTAYHVPFEPDYYVWRDLSRIAVDTAQAGVFDTEAFNDSPDDFQRRIEAATEKEGHGAIDEGYVAMSGYGDGLYQVHIQRGKGSKVKAVRITFIEAGEDA